MARAAAVLAITIGLLAGSPTAALAQVSGPSPAGAPVQVDARAGDPSAVDPIRQAERLLAAGRAEEAWAILEPLVAELAGNPDFDYLLGLAALDSGRPGQAIFALERVLMARPDFLPARAEIARAYFMAREPENARREFAAVAARRIPDAARRTIGRYLDAIERGDRAAVVRAQSRLELQVDAGHDTNVNFGSASGQWLLGDGTAVTPLAASLPRSSNTVGAALAFGASGPVGASIAGPLAGRLEWNLAARASLRHYARVSDFDQQQFDLSAGLSLVDGCHRYTLAALLQHLRLDDAAYRNAAGALLQWQCETDPRTLVGASLQSYRLDYPGAEIRDARRNAIGLNAARILDTAARPIVIGSIAFGEEASRPGLDNLSHEFLSLRAGLVARLSPEWRSSTVLSWEKRDFGAAEPLFGVVREDRQTELRIEFERRVNDRTSIVPQLVHTRNRSTLSPNDFRRTQAGVQLRHRF